jgi:predicted dehydrogenase
MRVILIGEEKAQLWEKIIRKNLSDCELLVCDRHFDGEFKYYDVAVITIPHPVLVEDSLKDAVPTLCTVPPSRNINQVVKLCKISEANRVPLIMAPAFVFSETFLNTYGAMQKIGKIKHINITYSDPAQDKNEDVVWTIGYDMFCALSGILEEVQNQENIHGIGLQGAAFGSNNMKNWVNCSFFINDKDKVQTSANCYISNIDDLDKKISITGTRGRVSCYPLEKEVHLKDMKGRLHSKISTTNLSQEEEMFRFFLTNKDDAEINGQVGSYAVALCNEILEAFDCQAEHIEFPT